MTIQPDIVLIITDQQQAGAASGWGWRTCRTPHLDRLIAGGVTSTRAYCTNPVCAPSRFSLITGLMPSVGGARSNDGPHRQPAAIMQSAIGHRLRRAGYRCAYAGKQHLPGMQAEDAGFEVISRDERDDCAETARALLARPGGQPLFLVVSLINPHDICYVPHWQIAPETMTSASSQFGRSVLERVCAPLLGLAPDRLDDFIRAQAPALPPNHRRNGSEPAVLERIDRSHRLREIPHRRWDERQWRLYRWIYDRLLEDVDRQIGLVTEAIDVHRPDALVIVTSDHGEMAGAHQLTQKTCFYEEAIRVPLLARWRQRIPAASRCDLLASNGLDCLPTILDAAGTGPAAGLDGLSLLPAWTGQRVTRWRERLWIEDESGDAIHDGRRKVERYHQGEVIVRDLVEDPWELRALPATAGDLAQFGSFNRPG